MDPKTQTIKHICQTHLTSFTRLAFGMTHPGSEYRHHWPMEVIGDYLTRCHEGEYRRLIINMPPRYLKSFFVSVAFPAWVLGRRPETKVMCIAGSRGLADDQHLLTKNLMSHAKYRSLFPHLRWNESSQTIRLAHGGSRSAHTASPGGGITGRGADMIIIDDPLSASHADDDNRREQVNHWYGQNIYQRLNDKTKGVVIVVMQRLHVDDLTGHLLKQEGWEILNLPAIATEDERYPRLYGDRVIRDKGEALHPGIEDREQLRQMMLDMGALAFMSQYQQDPYPPGQGKGYRGAITALPPEPGMSEMNCAWFFGHIPEEDTVLEKVFGERPSFRPGTPNLTLEEWEKKYPEDMMSPI